MPPKLECGGGRLVVGLAVVPQQHRPFAIVPILASVAVGAGLGGLVLAVGGSAAPTLVAALIGMVAILLGVIVVPERMR